jgi:hypothetical protein
MREDRLRAQANSASSRAIRWMIRTTMLGVEGKLPAVEARTQHAGLLAAAVACQDMQLEAAKAKAERLDAHYKRQKTGRAKRQAARIRKEARERVAAMERTVKRVRGDTGS